MKNRAMEEYQKVMQLRKQGLGRYEITRVTGIPLGTVGLWLRGIKPRRRLNKSREIFIKNLQLAHLKLQKLRNKRLIELSNKVTPEFAYVLGALLGDGYIYFHPNGGAHVRISVKDEDFAQAFYKSLKNWSKMNCRMYKYRDFWRVYSCSIVVAKVLEGFDLNKLRELSQRIICPFLRALFDSEGGVNKSPRRVRFYNSDIKLINVVQNLLRIIGIDKINISKREKEVHVFNGRKYLVRPVYCLSFGRKKNLQLFSEKIGFSIQRKQEKLERVLTSYHRNPLFWTNEEIEFLRKNLHRNYHKIAEGMKRSVSSVRHALYRYGLKPKIDNRLLS